MTSGAENREGERATSAGPAAAPTGAGANAGVPARWRLNVQAASVLLGIAAITVYVEIGPASRGLGPSARSEQGPGQPVAALGPSSSSPPPSTSSSPSAAAVPVAPEKPPTIGPPAAPKAPLVDRARVAPLEQELDAASRDRARADARAAEAAERLARAARRAAVDTLRARKLAFRVHDPSTRITQAAARGGFLKGQRDRLASEVATLRRAPRPKSQSVLGKSPVARPANDHEFHFELRHERISFIDLDALMEKTRADAQVRVRMADRFGPISSMVGPIGGFSLAYELVPSTPGNVEELIERRGSRRFDLKGWELVPRHENRGETYETTRNPISQFAQALNRIAPESATITLWVYPDSFTIFRRIRDELTERGFSVAGRPLPEGLAIRGSPMGTQSAAQ